MNIFKKGLLVLSFAAVAAGTWTGCTPDIQEFKKAAETALVADGYRDLKNIGVERDSSIMAATYILTYQTSAPDGTLQQKLVQCEDFPFSMSATIIADTSAFRKQKKEALEANKKGSDGGGFVMPVVVD
ncbi:MAG: hypothetical protein HY052_02350 [Proteobacteria bacterium]|nr:hypothetical protein [Pseudomonadota bacterium]